MSGARFTSTDQFIEIECVAQNITEAEWLDGLRAMQTANILRYITSYGRLQTTRLQFLREVLAERLVTGDGLAQAVIAEIDRQLADG
jgi:hypothetical protein